MMEFEKSTENSRVKVSRRRSTAYDKPNTTEIQCGNSTKFIKKFNIFATFKCVRDGVYCKLFIENYKKQQHQWHNTISVMTVFVCVVVDIQWNC